MSLSTDANKTTTEDGSDGGIADFIALGMAVNILERKLAVIGLGYVGLPLAVEFGKKRPVIGFDINAERISHLQSGYDATQEITSIELKQAHYLTLTANLEEVAFCDTFIVTVPTPVNAYKNPDFSALISASDMLGPFIKQGSIVIYESTVYPGAIEEICIPVLEKNTMFKLNRDFFVGYSPERVNPGDKEHRISNVKKITSASTPEAAKVVDELYNEIVAAGTYRVSSIRIAEAAKVIENIQRDINVALMNELAVIFNRLDIDTEEVLKAAGTKWNFLPFRPGLVGGHCIGVDPYYFIHKANSVGCYPEIIHAARRLNERMGEYTVSQLTRQMLKHQIHIDNADILIMGVTFKENCPDIRNSQVINIIKELQSYNARIHVYDPCAKALEVEQSYGVQLIDQPESAKYDAIMLTVGHDQFREMGHEKVRSFGKKNHVIYDLKYILPRESSDLRL